MRKIALTLGMAWLLLAPTIPVAQDGGEDPTDKRLRELLDRLGADDPAAREKASQELSRLGLRWIEALRNLARVSEDPEIRARATGVLDALKQDPTITRERLRSVAVDVVMEQGTLSDLLNSITAKTGVKFILQFDEMNHIGELEGVAFRGVSLEAVLDRFSTEYELKWGIDAEQRVFLMSRSAFYSKFAETRVFDLSALVDPPRDHAEEDPHEDGMSGSEIVELLQTSIEPSTWGDDNVWMNTTDKRLMVRHLPDVLKRIERTLSELRARVARTVKMELVAFFVDPAKVRAWLKPETRDPSGEQVQALLSRVQGEEEVKRFAWLQLTAVNGRGVRGSQAEESSFVVGFKVERSGERMVVLPATTQVLEGLDLFLRPRISDDGKRVGVEMELKATKVLEIETVKTEAGEIRLPKVATLELKQTVELMNDRWSLIGMATPTLKPDLRLVILGRAEIGK